MREAYTGYDDNPREEPEMNHALDFTLDDLRQIDAALCIAAASYLDGAETHPFLHDRDRAGKDANACRDLANRIGRHLADT